MNLISIAEITIQDIELGQLKNLALRLSTHSEISEVRPYNQERHYRFPALDECRKHLLDKYGIEIKSNIVD